MSDLIIGIDLGTTNSEVAAFVDGKVRVLGPGEIKMLPSCVGISPSGELLVGESARNQQLVYPERTVRSIKRKMGSTRDRIAGRQEVHAAGDLRADSARTGRVGGPRVEAAGDARGDHGAGVLLRCAAQCHARSGHDGRPGSGAHPQRADRRQPGVRLRRRRAAHGDGVRSGRRDVRRLGGHWWKATSPRCWPATATIAWAATTSTICCWSSCRREFHQRHGVRIGAEHPLALARLWWAAEIAKKQLSFEPYAQIREEALITQNGKPLHLELELSRAEYEKMILPLVESTLDSVSKALEDAGKKAERAGRDPAGGRFHAHAAGVAPAARTYRTGAARGRASRSVRGAGRRSAGVALGGPRRGARAGGRVARTRSAPRTWGSAAEFRIRIATTPSSGATRRCR